MEYDIYDSIILSLRKGVAVVNKSHSDYLLKKISYKKFTVI